MSWTPTDEQVEKAAEALDPIAFDLGRMVFPLFGQTPQEARAADQESARRRARAVLVAVGPMIAASALRGFADGWVADLSAELVGRTMLKTAMHDRADVYMSQIEEEAGR
jgi:hypothetical protein